jgi:hypothetical protein
MPTLTPKARSLLWKTPSGFGLSHCMNCALSWTRSGKDGGKLTICLLDREPVLDDMTDCSRFEMKLPPSSLSATDATSSALPEPPPPPKTKIHRSRSCRHRAETPERRTRPRQRKAPRTKINRGTKDAR